MSISVGKRDMISCEYKKSGWFDKMWGNRGKGLKFREIERNTQQPWSIWGTW